MRNNILNTKISLFLLLTFGMQSCHKEIPTLAYQEPAIGDKYFSIAIIPDTQYYTAEVKGGNIQLFKNQIDWIKQNAEKEKIVYVTHLGDVTNGNTTPEWQRARSILDDLKASKIPFGIAVGNHDQTPYGNPGNENANTRFTKHFGKSYFDTLAWYGGAMGINNNSDNHFDLFDCFNKKFIAIYLDYNEPTSSYYNNLYEQKVFSWADSLLNLYSNRQAIIISHSILHHPEGSTSIYLAGKQKTYIKPTFTDQGLNIYNNMKNFSNVFLMLCGHAGGEGYRIDNSNGHIINTILSDYQFREFGGNGTMRLLTFNITKKIISIKTFISGTNIIEENDVDSRYSFNWQERD